MFYLKAGFHMIADRRSQTSPIDRRRSQEIEHGSIFCDCLRSRSQDRRKSFHMIADDRRPYCDLQSYGNQPLDRTWFYLLRSSAITIAESQTIADLIEICDHMETSLNHPTEMIRISSLWHCLLCCVLRSSNF